MVKQKPRNNKSSNDFLSAVKDIQRFTYEAMTSKEKKSRESQFSIHQEKSKDAHQNAARYQRQGSRKTKE